MWKLRTKIIPVVIGPLGMIKKRTQNFIDFIEFHSSHSPKNSVNLKHNISLKRVT